MKTKVQDAFLVLKDDDGVLRPMAFITTKNRMGEQLAKEYEKKLLEGEKIVEVLLVEVAE